VTGAAETLAPFFPTAGPRIRLELGEGASGRLVRVSGGAACGTFTLESTAVTLVVQSLCVDESLRGYGLGSEAGGLLRDVAERGHWQILRAWAPPDRGLAVYFWIRMGLHPLPGEGPDAGLWFERDVRHP
jgi:hypothetical protein